jgi:solute carrier family 50 protein (sugar transporter)
MLAGRRSSSLGQPAHADALLQNDSTGSQGPAAKAVHTPNMIQLGIKDRLEQTLHPWLHPLSVAAVVTTVALQLSPMPSSLEIKRDRDVKRYDGYPYFSVLAGATQWCLYGSYSAYQLHDSSFLTMVAANGPGMFFGIFYISNFFRFCPPEDPRYSALKKYLSIGAALLLVQAATCIVLGRGGVFWLGLLGSIGSAQIALSPFKTLPEVLRTRSTRSWPFDLCFWNLVQSWFTGGFGLANSDMWVFVPNLIGVIGAVIQLSLVFAFWERAGGSRGTTLKLKAAAALV